MFERESSFPTRKIVDLCTDTDDIKCGPFGTQLKQSEYTSSGVAIWGIPQINAGFSIAPDNYVTEDKAKKLEAFSLRSGDIAMSRKGNVGQCALYPETFEPGIIASDVLRIRTNAEIVDPLFLQQMLHHSESVKRQILLVSDGAVMAGINVTKLKNISVIIPPLSLQKNYAAFVQQLDKSKFVAQKATQLLQCML